MKDGSDTPTGGQEDTHPGSHSGVMTALIPIIEKGHKTGATPSEKKNGKSAEKEFWKRAVKKLRGMARKHFKKCQYVDLIDNPDDLIAYVMENLAKLLTGKRTTRVRDRRHFYSLAARNFKFIVGEIKRKYARHRNHPFGGAVSLDDKRPDHLKAQKSYRYGAGRAGVNVIEPKDHGPLRRGRPDPHEIAESVMFYDKYLDLDMYMQYRDAALEAALNREPYPSFEEKVSDEDSRKLVELHMRVSKGVTSSNEGATNTVAVVSAARAEKPFPSFGKEVPKVEIKALKALYKLARDKGNLPIRKRLLEIYDLHKLNDLSFQAIAAMLEMKKSTVAELFHKAELQIKKILQPAGKNRSDG